MYARDSRVRRVARTARRAFRLAVQAAENRSAASALMAGPGVRSSPHIVVDGCVFQESPEGIARVWSSVLDEWSATGFASNVTLLDRAGTAPRLPGYAYRDLPRVRERDSASQRELLQAVCTTEAADLFVSTLYTTPLCTPTALLLHDFTPEALGWDLSLPMWRERAGAISYASAYACISNSTASDLARFYPHEAEKPRSVAYLAVDPTFAPAHEGAVEALRAELDLTERYYLFMGLRDDHKNAVLVLDTLASWEGDTGFAVLFVGGSPVAESVLAERAGAVSVRVARRLSEAELRAAYTGATALLYPSLYEGFGLPVLEAMACDCPVICSDRGSLPEVAGNATIVIDPTSPRSLADAMREVPRPEVRARLIELGRANCTRFSWALTAKALSDVLEAAADSAAS